jgi:hypothetical protein
LTAINPLTLIWETTGLEEAKFYTAVAAFQQPATGTKTASDIDALKIIVKNPFQLPVYFHDAKISENITATAIVPVQLQTSKTDIQLSVDEKGLFYEVSGTLEVKGKTYDLHALKVRYGYFLLVEETMYLLTNPDVLRVIDFFKKNNHNLLMHTSKYEAFRQNILEKLEQRIGVKYKTSH